MKINVLILFPLFLLLCSVSCDPMLEYQFFVENQSSDNISIQYIAGTTDTTLTLAPGTEALLFRDSRVGKQGQDYMGEEMYVFSKINIYKNDSIPIKKDIYKRQHWDYAEITYRLKVLDSDF